MALTRYTIVLASDIGNEPNDLDSGSLFSRINKVRSNHALAAQQAGNASAYHNLAAPYNTNQVEQSQRLNPDFISVLKSMFTDLAVFVINKKDFKHDPENYSLCYISSSLDFIPPQEKETYFTFLRALIARYNDKISWIYDSYDNHFKMKMILDGLNKDKKATYEIATEHI